MQIQSSDVSWESTIEHFGSLYGDAGKTYLLACKEWLWFSVASGRHIDSPPEGLDVVGMSGVVHGRTVRLLEHAEQLRFPTGTPSTDTPISCVRWTIDGLGGAQDGLRGSPVLNPPAGIVFAACPRGVLPSVLCGETC